MELNAEKGREREREKGEGEGEGESFLAIYINDNIANELFLFKQSLLHLVCLLSRA